MTLHETLRKAERIAVNAWFVIVVAAHTDAGVAFPLWMTLFAAMVVLAGWWLARVGLTLVFSRDAPESWRSRLWVPAVLLTGVLLTLTQFPLMARVRLSERSLISGHSGLFRVREFQRFDNGELRFLTSSCGLVDQCGVVYSPAGRPPNRGEDSFTHLYGSWWHWQQSW